MLFKILFWLFIALDVAALGLFFVLGLAAAGPSHTSWWSVSAYMLLIPGLLLAAAVAIFVTSKFTLARAAAFLIAAAPMLYLVGLSAMGSFEIWSHKDAAGNVRNFTAGPMRELENAIARNDAAAVASAAKSADLNQLALDGSSVLVVALRHLEKNPGPPDVLQALLRAGADPNAKQMDLPLTVAIQVSRATGPQPVKLLLESGADPNARTSFGKPVYFSAAGIGTDPEVLPLLLDRGANLSAVAANGSPVLLDAVQSRNWKAVLLLLERGANWNAVRDLSGRDFRQMLEEDARIFGADPVRDRAKDYLK